MLVSEFSPASPASNDEKCYNSIYLKSFVVKKEDFENLKLPQIRNLVLKNVG